MECARDPNRVWKWFEKRFQSKPTPGRISSSESTVPAWLHQHPSALEGNVEEKNGGVRLLTARFDGGVLRRVIARRAKRSAGVSRAAALGGGFSSVFTEASVAAKATHADK